jgi:protein SCO1
MKKLLFVPLLCLLLAACSSGSTKTVYACPMKCEGEKVYEKKGQCPVCEMDLEAVKQ